METQALSKSETCLDHTSGISEYRPNSAIVDLFTDPRELLEALVKAGFYVGKWAKEVIECQDHLSATRQATIPIVILSGTALGLCDNPTTGDIYARAECIGHRICPLLLGPYLRLQYKYQPRGEHLIIATEPTISSEGYPLLFSVTGEDDGLWLRAIDGHKFRSWTPNQSFVFLK